MFDIFNLASKLNLKCIFSTANIVIKRYDNQAFVPCKKKVNLLLLVSSSHSNINDSMQTN